MRPWPPGSPLRSGTHLNSQSIKATTDAGRSLKPRLQVSRYDARCLMVQAGMEIGLLPTASAGIYRVQPPPPAT
jgi:hypothetical protein